ncbi:MAG: YtxH domain-containing protein [Azoarcus sp.]|jgi:hypothetical protein|nr:YtxH domain-containing protein [Azoarcus sp.]
MSKKGKAKKARKAARLASGFSGFNSANAAAPGFFSEMGAWLRKRPSEQFLVGAVLGAAAVYVLSNEELRAKILKGGIELYGSVAGGLAELREQMADIKAEIEVEKTGEGLP